MRKCMNARLDPADSCLTPQIRDPADSHALRKVALNRFHDDMVMLVFALSGRE